MSNEDSIKASILLTLLKCIVMGCSNGNQSFTGRLFSNYGPWNKLFHFFRYLILSVFHETFVKKFMNLSFFSSNFKNPFQDVVCYWKLECLTLWYWNGGLLNISKNLKNLSVFGAVFFSEIKKCWHFEFSWIKYFGNDFLFLIKWHIWLMYESTIVGITGRRTWKKNWK